MDAPYVESIDDEGSPGLNSSCHAPLTRASLFTSSLDKIGTAWYCEQLIERNQELLYGFPTKALRRSEPYLSLDLENRGNTFI